MKFSSWLASMSVSFLATQLGVPLCQQQLELGSLLLTFSKLLIGAQTPFLDVFIIVQSMIPPLGSRCYPLVGLTHESISSTSPVKEPGATNNTIDM